MFPGPKPSCWPVPCKGRLQENPLVPELVSRMPTVGARLEYEPDVGGRAPWHVALRVWGCGPLHAWLPASLRCYRSNFQPHSQHTDADLQPRRVLVRKDEEVRSIDLSGKAAVQTRRRQQVHDLPSQFNSPDPVLDQDRIPMPGKHIHPVGPEDPVLVRFPRFGGKHSEPDLVLWNWWWMDGWRGSFGINLWKRFRWSGEMPSAVASKVCWSKRLLFLAPRRKLALLGRLLLVGFNLTCKTWSNLSASRHCINAGQDETSGQLPDRSRLKDSIHLQEWLGIWLLHQKSRIFCLHPQHQTVWCHLQWPRVSKQQLCKGQANFMLFKDNFTVGVYIFFSNLIQLSAKLKIL